jgi:hypothetical protein
VSNVHVSDEPFIRRSQAGGYIYDNNVLGSVERNSGTMTLYPAAFEYGYYGLASVIDHEILHVRQFMANGPYKDSNERSLREFAAYKYQASRANFRKSSYLFKQYQISGWYGEINKFRKNNGLWADDGCGADAICIN